MAAACLAAPVVRSSLGLGASANEWIALAGGAAGALVSSLDAVAASHELPAPAGARKKSFTASRAGTAVAAGTVLAILVGIATGWVGVEADWDRFGVHVNEQPVGLGGLFGTFWYGGLFALFLLFALGAAAGAGMLAMMALLGIASAHVGLTWVARTLDNRFAASVLFLAGALLILFRVESFGSTPSAPYAALVPVALTGAAWLVPRGQPRWATAAALIGLVAATFAARALAVRGGAAEQARIESRTLPLCDAVSVAGVKCFSTRGADLTAIPDGTRPTADLAGDLAAMGDRRCLVRDDFRPSVARYADARVAEPIDIRVKAQVDKPLDATDPELAVVDHARAAVRERYRGFNENVCNTVDTPLPALDTIWVDCGGAARCRVDARMNACDAGPTCAARLKGPPTRYIRDVKVDLEIVGPGAERSGASFPAD